MNTFFITLQTMFAILGVGLVLLLTGWTWREYPAGVVAMWAGILTCLATIGYKFYITVY